MFFWTLFGRARPPSSHVASLWSLEEVNTPDRSGSSPSAFISLMEEEIRVRQRCWISLFLICVLFSLFSASTSMYSWVKIKVKKLSAHRESPELPTMSSSFLFIYLFPAWAHEFKVSWLTSTFDFLSRPDVKTLWICGFWRLRLRTWSRETRPHLRSAVSSLRLRSCPQRCSAPSEVVPLCGGYVTDPPSHRSYHLCDWEQGASQRRRRRWRGEAPAAAADPDWVMAQIWQSQSLCGGGGGGALLWSMCTCITCCKCDRPAHWPTRWDGHWLTSVKSAAHRRDRGSVETSGKHRFTLNVLIARGRCCVNSQSRWETSVLFGKWCLQLGFAVSGVEMRTLEDKYSILMRGINRRPWFRHSCLVFDDVTDLMDAVATETEVLCSLSLWLNLWFVTVLVI